MYQRLMGCLLLAILLAGCGLGKSTPTPAATPTQNLDAVVEATLAAFTPSPVPPTQTSAPTPTIAASATPAPTATATPVIIYGPDNFPADINPLTGLKVADPSLLLQRPIAVKVNIIPAYTRPPWGLSLAAIVYEYYHQTGDTRFHAIFYGQNADLIGPIRSGRILDDSLIQMYKSIFVYGHADPVIDAFFYRSNYFNRLVVERWAESACPPTDKLPLCRFEPQQGDYMLGSTQAIHAYEKAQGVKDDKQNLDGMLFSAGQPSNGQAGKEATTRYSYNSYNRWEYDPQSGRYMRLQDSVETANAAEEFVPLTDRLTKQPIGSDNVVIILAPHRNYNPPGGNQIVDITLSGSGTAYAFRDGQVYKVTWNRPAADSVLYLTYADGTRYPFKPGTTWIEVVDTGAKITQPADGAWRFEQFFH